MDRNVLCRWVSLVAVLAMIVFPESASLLAGSSNVAASAAVYGLSSILGVPASPSIDVSDQLTMLLAGVVTPATVVLEGMYRIDHSVEISGATGLKIVGGSGTGFVRYTQATQPAGWPAKKSFYPYIAIKDGTNITLEGFAIQGPLAARAYNSTLETAHGVAVMGRSQDVLVKGLTIRGVHGDFVYLNSDAVPSNVTFENIYGEVAGRQASTVAGGNGVLYRSVTFLKAARSGLDLEPANPLGSNNVTVEDSTLKDFGNFCFAVHQNVNNLTVRRTSCVGGRGIGKFGTPETYTGPNNSGLVLEDVRYDWQGTLPPNASAATITVQRTNGVAVTRMNAYFRSRGGMINGSGVVSDSVFTSYAAATRTTPAVVCLGAGMSSVNNVGTGPPSACVYTKD